MTKGRLEGDLGLLWVLSERTQVVMDVDETSWKHLVL